MKLKYFILSLLFTIFFKSEAQSSVQLFEGGTQFYIPVSIGGNLGGDPSSIGAGLQADFRVNLPNSKFDIGIFTQFGKTYRDFWFIGLNEEIYRGHNSSFTTSTLGVNSNYNFRQGMKINPYAGLGIGVAFHDSHIACISNSTTLAWSGDVPSFANSPSI